MTRILLTLAILTLGQSARAQADDAAMASALVIVNDAADMCKDLGGSFAFGDGALQKIDVTGDDIPDLILDEAKLECSNAASLYCGTGGCALHAFVGPVQTSWFVRDWRIIKEYDSTILLFALHGGACGSYGADICFEAVAWNGSTFLSTGTR